MAKESKATFKRMKIHSKDCKVIFANHISSLGLVSRIYKHFSKHNSKETNNPAKKINDFNGHITKDCLQRQKT